MKPCFLVCTPYWTTYEKSKNIQFVRALHIPIFFFNMLFQHVKERLQLLYIFLHIWLWSIGPNHKCKQAIDQSMFCKQMQSCPGKQLFCKRMQIFCERMQSFQENRMCLSVSSNIKIVFFFLPSSYISHHYIPLWAAQKRDSKYDNSLQTDHAQSADHHCVSVLGGPEKAGSSA